ncbi:MAG: hypothetical protein K0S70_804 [Microbacterium sp.]|jgi:uncharacterized protein (TIGR02391 family)|nr:hypothetical protein [Microbacterium sp.]
MTERKELTENERAIQVAVVGERSTLGALLDTPTSEAGMRILDALAKSPQTAQSAHNIVAHAHAGLLSAGIRGQRATELRRSIERRVADGLAWLIARALVGPAAEHSGAPYWIITTDGIEAAARGSVAHVDATLRLHADLHSALDTSARPNFERGDYATAVFAATHEVEVAVRQASGFGSDRYGTQLMRDAFKVGGPLAASDDPVAEQEAVRDLFVGTIGAFKNPSSHRVVHFDSPIEAANVVHLADTLLRIIDRAKQRRAV